MASACSCVPAPPSSSSASSRSCRRVGSRARGRRHARAFAIQIDPTGAYLLLRDDKPFTKAGLEFEHALLLLEAQVRAHIALHAPDRIFVHAGVVAHRGRASCCRGLSFAGKTTLVAALVRAGATYYSDEFAPLDADGLVHPYARPLSLRDGQWSRSPQPVATLVVSPERCRCRSVRSC